MKSAVVVLLALLPGCDPTPGVERGPCYPNGTCNAGLTCASQLCVRFPDGSVDARPVEGARRDAAQADAAPDTRGADVARDAPSEKPKAETAPTDSVKPDAKDSGPADLDLADKPPDLPPPNPWLTSFGGAGAEEVESVAVDSTDGSVYLTGRFAGTFTVGKTTLTSPSGSTGAGDLFVVKLDSTGAPLWAISGSSAGEDIGDQIVVEPAAGIFLAGRVGAGALLAGKSVSGGGCLFAKLDSAGGVAWSFAVGAMADARSHLTRAGRRASPARSSTPSRSAARSSCRTA